ncbi:hypothetical protein GCM10027063_15960 [Promicromonospora xylanilytica]
MNDVDPVGIVGIGCRFPGAGSPEEMWGMLSRGEHAVRPLPPERLAARFYDPVPGTPGRSAVRAGALLQDVERFDQRLFGISPREAQFMDPMQRILLEVTWHALEDAGIDPMSLAGSRTGVFVGSYAPDFTVLQAVGPRFPEDLAPQAGPNALHSMASGRVAHAFDLAGPALTLDTACSSSLVALHLALRSLRAGECDLALVGGVNLALTPDSWVNLSHARMASADGRSKGFSADADGYGRGEGCGVLVLERTAVSARRGARVRAVVRGTAMNHDGRSSTMLSPSRGAQVAVARAALADAGVDPADVALVEAHGTGTPTGDPIELGALGDVYGSARTTGRLLVGSVKSNINHTEAASGVAGVIKSVLALEHDVIPPHLLVGSPTTAVDLEQANLRIVTEPERWPDGARIVGVNSFGLSGTNAHALLEAAPPAREPGPAAPARHVLTLSAGTEDGLRSLAARWADTAEAGAELRDLAHTARAGRADLEHRAAVVAADARGAAGHLRGLATGSSGPAVHTGRVRGSAPVVLCFSGQGSQRAGAGAALYAEGGTFTAELDAAAAAFDGLLADALGTGGPTLLDVVLGRAAEADELIARTDLTQPALFALEVALARTLESLGVVPAAVTGHSIGALAAAVVAGHLDLAAGARLVAARGRLMAATEAGAMVAVVGTPAAVDQVLAGVPDGVEVAARNAPGAVTLSGPVEAVDALVALLDEDGATTAHRLAVGHAFHSAAMDPVAQELGRLAVAEPRGRGRVPFVSDVDGTVVGVGEVLPADHWSRHVRGTVRFEDAVRAASGGGRSVFVEVGPGGTLVGLARRALGAGRAPSVVTLGHRGPESSDDLRAALFVAGALPGVATARHDTTREHDASPEGARLVRAPRYPFGGVPLLSPAVRDNLARLAERSGGGSRTAGGRVALPEGGWAFGSVVGPDDTLLADHALFGEVVVPGAFWLSQVTDAARQLAREAGAHAPGVGEAAAGRAVLTDVLFEHPLVPAGATYDVTVRLRPVGQGPGWTFDVLSRPRRGHTEVRHARGTVRVDAQSPAPARTETAVPEASLSRAEFYARMRERGIELGTGFQAVTTVGRTEPGHAAGVLDRPASGRSPFHPGLMDAWFQLVAAALPDAVTDALRDRGSVVVPVGAEEITVTLDGLRGGPVAVDVTEVHDGGRRVRADIGVGDEASLRGVVLGEISPALLGLAPTGDGPEREVVWVPLEGDEPARPAAGRRVGLLDGGAWSPDVVTVLTDAGAAAVVDSAGTSAALPTDTTDLVLAVVPWAGAHTDADGLLSAAVDACARLTDVVRHAAEHGTRAWLLVSDADGDPVASAAVGLARTVASEHPGVFGAVLDVGPGDAVSVARALRRTVLAERPEPQVRVRDGVVLRPVLRAAGAHRSSLAAEGTWVITGGSGALARHTAGHLLERGAAHVALLSRGAPDPAALAALAEAAGPGRVSHHVADVSDEATLAAALDAVRADHGPLRGAVHAAGVLADGPLLDVRRADLATVLRPKVAGAANLLATLERDAELLLYSSVAGTLGTPLQGVYAAANASLDAFAVAARAAGRPVSSVAWGPWAGDGMVATGSSAEVVERLGLRPLAPAAALAGLDSVRSAGTAHQVVADAGWAAVARALGGPVVTGLVDATADAPAALASGPVDEATVLVLLTDAVASATRAPADTVDIDGPLASLGVDSIAAIDLRSQLATATGVQVPVPMLLGGATLRAIAEHVVSAVGGSTASRGEAPGEHPLPAATDDPEAVLARLDDMSDAEVEAALAALASGQEGAR